MSTSIKGRRPVPWKKVKTRRTVPNAEINFRRHLCNVADDDSPVESRRADQNHIVIAVVARELHGDKLYVAKCYIILLNYCSKLEVISKTGLYVIINDKTKILNLVMSENTFTELFFYRIEPLEGIWRYWEAKWARLGLKINIRITTHNNINVWEQRIAEIEATMALPRFFP